FSSRRRHTRSYGDCSSDVCSSDLAPSANPLAPKKPHFAPKAKHVIHLFMNGGPSQVDTFDPKPALDKLHGQQPPKGTLKTERKTGGLHKSPFRFHKSGRDRKSTRL